MKPSLLARLRGNPSRVFLAFSLGIVLPAGFLSYLGFRSFKTEERLLQQQAAERHRTVADVLERKAQQTLLQPLDALRRVADRRAFRTADRPAASRDLLALQSLAGLPVQARYWLDARDQVLFPKNASAADPAEGAIVWRVHAGEIRRLEQLEFRSKEYDQALAGYEALLRNPLSRQQQAWVLKCMAGLEHKLGNDGAAETIYGRLLRDYEDVLDPSGDPIALLSRLWLAERYDARRDRDHAARMRLEAAEGLLLHRWPESPRAADLLEDTMAALAKTMRAGIEDEDLRARWEQLQAQRRALREATAKADVFERHEWPAWSKRLRQRGWSDTGGIFRLKPEFAQEAWGVVVPVWSTGQERRVGTLVVVVTPQELLKNATKELEDIAAGDALSFSLAKPAWKPMLASALPSLDPPIVLSLREPGANPADQLSRRRLWIYGGMVGLSLLVILIGLVLMGQAMRRELEIATLKSDFVANVSHELRTPLAAVAYIADRLNRGRYRSEEDVKELYAMLSQESGRLQEMIDDVLNFSKTLGGPRIYTKEAVDLREVAHEALDRLRGKADAAGFHLQFAAPAAALLVHADRRAAVQAVANLIDNAIKYSGDAREVSVSLRHDEGFGAVAVADRGLGIAPDQQEKIFEKFHRAHDREAKAGGIGLGLAMVKHIMDNHGGRIEVRSAPGQGSVFTLWFPREIAPGTAPE